MYLLQICAEVCTTNCFLPVGDVLPVGDIFFNGDFTNVATGYILPLWEVLTVWDTVNWDTVHWDSLTHGLTVGQFSPVWVILPRIFHMWGTVLHLGKFFQIFSIVEMYAEKRTAPLNSSTEDDFKSLNILESRTAIPWSCKLLRIFGIDIWILIINDRRIIKNKNLYNR